MHLCSITIDLSYCVSFPLSSNQDVASLFFLIMCSASSYLSPPDPCAPHPEPTLPPCTPFVRPPISTIFFQFLAYFLILQSCNLIHRWNTFFSWLARKRFPDNLSWISISVSPCVLHQTLCTRFQRSWRGRSTSSSQPTPSLWKCRRPSCTCRRTASASPLRQGRGQRKMTGK